MNAERPMVISPENVAQLRKLTEDFYATSGYDQTAAIAAILTGHVHALLLEHDAGVDAHVCRPEQ